MAPEKCARLSLMVLVVVPMDAHATNAVEVSSGSVTYTTPGAALVVDSNIALDAANIPITPTPTSLSGGTVIIESGFVKGEDFLSCTAPSGISCGYVADAGILYLTGSGTYADYQTALRTVTYTNMASTATPGDRSIRYTLGAGTVYLSQSHHLYKRVVGAQTWFSAKSTCGFSSQFGVAGYMATPQSAEEQALLVRTGTTGWIGAADQIVEGEWRWRTGPESTLDTTGQYFYNPDAGALDGGYTNWAPGQPANSAGDEDFAYLLSDGGWASQGFDTNRPPGYWCEWGGNFGSVVYDMGTLSGARTVTIQNSCMLDPNGLACPTGDTDGDGVLNGVDASPSNPCLPSGSANGCSVALNTVGAINASNAASYSVSGTCADAAGDVSVSVGPGMATVTCSGGVFSRTFDVSGQADATSITVSASQTLNSITATVTRTTVKDTVVVAPVILAPTNNQQVAPNPTISGTSEAGAAVTVRDDDSGNILCMVVADSLGAWSCVTTLTSSTWYAMATQTDTAGNTSAYSGVTFFRIATMPVVTLTAPGVLNAASASAFTLSGTCRSINGTVSVSAGSVNGTTACTSQAFSLVMDLSGEPDSPTGVSVTASQTNVVGTGTATMLVPKDTVAVTPVIVLPAESSSVGPSVTVVGTGEPLAAIRVVNKNGVTLCSATVDMNGDWTCGYSATAGSTQIVARETDTFLNLASSTGRKFTVVASTPVVTVTTPGTITAANQSNYGVAGSCTTGAGDVTISVGSATSSTPCSAGAFSGALNVSSVPDATSVSVSASQTNGSGTGSDTKTALKDTTANSPVISTPVASAMVLANPSVSGTSEALSTVTVLEGAATVCTANADAMGAWSCTTTLGTGAHSITATQVDAVGNTSGASAARAFSVVGLPVVTLSTPGTMTAANQGSYTVSGSCTTGAGNVTIGVGSAMSSATCTAGSFSGALNVSSVSDATAVTVTASQTNVAGTGSDSKSALKDTTANAPVISTPAASAMVFGNPTVSGTVEALATVTVLEGSATVCTANADAMGAWSCSTTLGAGSHSITASMVDAVGNASAASAPRAFTVAGTPVVTLSTPGPINLANKASYPVSGTCTAGAGNVSLTVTSGSSSTAALTACNAGTFSGLVNTSFIPDATVIQVSAAQTNIAGTGSNSKNSVKDTVVVAPVIQQPANNGTVGASHSISGTAEAGASVVVRDGMTITCSLIADSGGGWSCPGPSALGSHSITAMQTDTVGNSSGASPATVYSVVSPPAVTVSTPAAINASNQAAYVVSGTCVSAAGTVSVSVGSVNGTTACTSAAFTATLNVSSLTDASTIAVTAAQTNGAGTGSASKNAVKDTVVDPPALLTPLDGAVVVVHPSLTGSSEADASVTVRDASNAIVCLAVADSMGSWSCTTNLAPGSVVVSAVQVDAAGNLSAASGMTGFTVTGPPAVALNAPVVINADSAAGYVVSGACTQGAGQVTFTVGNLMATATCAASAFSGTIDVSSLGDGSSIAVTAAQTNVSGTGTDIKSTSKDTVVVAPVISTPVSGATVALTPSLTGTSEPSAAITVRDGTTIVCMAIANSSGTWNCSTSLAAGTFGLTAVQTDAAGNTSSPSTTTALTVVGTPVVTLAAAGVINAANKTSYSVSGTCTAGSGNVSLAVGSATGSATCTSATFSATLDVSALADAAVVTVTATQTNVAGTGSDSRDTSKDTVVAPPVILAPAAFASVPASHLISGTAEKSASVTVNEAASVVCTALADSVTGAWSCSGSPAAGAHSVTATQLDSAGNASGASAAVGYTVVGTPVVALNPPGVINGSNVAVYPISGACDSSAGTVSVTAGSASASTTCNSGVFSTTINAGAVTDAPVVAVTAAQTNVAGTGTDSKNTVKDVIALPPAIVSPAEGSSVAAAPTLSGTAEPGAAITVREGMLQVCTAIASSAGDWSCATTFTSGSHAVTATQLDSAGNTSAASVATNFSIVGVPTVTVAAPTIITASTASAYVVTGACTDGAGNVSIAVGSTMGSASCTSGSFVASLDVSALGDGSTIAVTVSQTNVAGTGSDSKNTRKDTTALAPLISAPLAGNNVGPTPTIRGTGEAGATVTVREGTTVLCSDVATGTGAWACSAVFTSGAHSISATQTDVVGNVSPASTSTAFTVVTAPAVLLDAPLVVNAANASAYAVSGVCIANAGNVAVSVGTVMANTSCTAGMFVTLLDVTVVPDGTGIAVTAAQMNVGGTGTDAKTVTKDTVVAAPVIATPAMAAVVAPNPVLSGTAEPGASVTVREGSTTVCTVQAASSGMWECSSAWSSGAHSILALQTDVAGNTSATTAVVTFSIATTPTVVLDMPAVIAGANVAMFPIAGQCATAAGVVTVSVGTVSGTVACSSGMFTTSLNLTAVADAPSVTIRASQTNVAGTGTDARTTRKDTVASPPTFSSPPAGAMVGAHPSISGNAEPGAAVSVVEGSAAVCSASADMLGMWTCASTLEMGPHTLVATQVDAAGNRSAPSPGRSFTISSVPALTVMAMTINAANAASFVVRGTCTNGVGPVAVTVGSVNAVGGCVSGVFVVMPIDTTSVADGPAIAVSASQTNASGTGSANTTVLKDTVAPAAPTVESPVADSAVTSLSAIAGHAEAGARVTVTLDGIVIGTVNADAGGAWSAPTGTLAMGAHVASAAARDLAGNAGPRSPDLSFTVVSAIPLKIVSPVAGATLPPSVAVTVTGTAPVASVVTVSLDAMVVGSGSPGSDGSWSFVVPAENVTPGPHTLQVTAGSASDSISVVVSEPEEMMQEMPTTTPMKKCSMTGEAFSALVLCAAAFTRRRRKSI